MTALQRILKAIHRRPFIDGDEGLSTVEYVIILVLIAVVGIAVWAKFGEAVEAKVGEATEEINGL